MSINKQLVKKKQGQIKGLVTKFGSLIKMWSHDVIEIDQLINYLDTTTNKVNSIIKAYNNKSNSNSFLLINNLPQCFDDRVIKLLLYKISINIDNIYSQIRLFNKRLQDTIFAMMMISEDCSKIISNESHNVLDERDTNIIFTINHIIEIMTMQKSYSLEYDRKKLLLQQAGLINSNNITNNNTSVCYYSIDRNNNLTINKVREDYPDYCAVVCHQLRCINITAALLSNWGDQCPASYINDTIVNEFLLKNNIQ